MVQSHLKKIPGTLPSDYELYQNYPNPFNPTTQISYEITQQTDGSLEVFDRVGRQVAVREPIRWISMLQIYRAGCICKGYKPVQPYSSRKRRCLNNQNPLFCNMADMAHVFGYLRHFLVDDFSRPNSISGAFPEFC